MSRWTGRSWKGRSEGRMRSLGRPHRRGALCAQQVPRVQGGRLSSLEGSCRGQVRSGCLEHARQLPNPAGTSRWQSPCAHEGAPPPQQTAFRRGARRSGQHVGQFTRHEWPRCCYGYQQSSFDLELTSLHEPPCGVKRGNNNNKKAESGPKLT